MSDRIAVINHGRLVQFDTPSNLYDRPADRFVAEFIGESTFIPVQTEQGQAKLFGQTLSVRDAVPPGDQSWLLIRPEKLAWTEPKCAPANRIDGTATDVIYQGDSYLLTIALPDKSEIEVRCNPHIAGISVLEPGNPISFWLTAENTVLVGGRA